ARAPSRHIPVLLDGAHNPAAVDVLQVALRRDAAWRTAPDVRIRVFFALMNDKDLDGMRTRLRALSDDLVFVDLSGLNPRALTAEALRARDRRETAQPASPSAEDTRPASAEGEAPSPQKKIPSPKTFPEIRVVLPTRAALEPLW